MEPNDIKDAVFQPVEKSRKPENNQPLLTLGNTGASFIAASALLLSACDSDGDSQKKTTNNQHKYNQNETSKPNNDKEAARFLIQAQLSSTKEEIDALRGMTYANWIDNQFNEPVGQTARQWLKKSIKNNEIKVEQGTKISERMFWKELITCEDTLRKRMALALSEIYVVSVKHMPYPYRAACAASYWDMLNRHAFGNLRDLLLDVSRHFAMGKFLDVVNSKKAFNAGLNQPDENFARELMQLMTIGLVELNIDGTEKKKNGRSIETYDLNAVKEVARVFTGYKAPDGGHIKENTYFERFDKPMSSRPEVHDFGEKNILGHILPAIPTVQQNEQAMLAELNKVLDILFNHDNIAPFISKQLIMRFVTSNPSKGYVKRISQVFNGGANGVRGDLKEVIKAILLDSEARKIVASTSSEYQTIGKAREPMIMFSHWARTFTKKRSTSGKWNTFEMLRRLGQMPLGADTIFNFFRPGDAPLEPNFYTRNKVAPDLYLVDTVSVKDYSNFMYLIVQKGIYRRGGKQVEIPIVLDELIKLLPASRPAGDWTKDLTQEQSSPEKELVDYLDLVMCAGTMHSDTKKSMLKAMSFVRPRGTAPYSDKDIDVNTERARLALWITSICPEFRVQK